MRGCEYKSEPLKKGKTLSSERTNISFCFKEPAPSHPGFCHDEIQFPPLRSLCHRNVTCPVGSNTGGPFPTSLRGFRVLSTGLVGAFSLETSLPWQQGWRGSESRGTDS